MGVMGVVLVVKVLGIGMVIRISRNRKGVRDREVRIRINFWSGLSR